MPSAAAGTVSRSLRPAPRRPDAAEAGERGLPHELGAKLALLLALGAGLFTAADLIVRTWPLERLPLWDGAGNGWGTIELWSALADGRPIDFLLRLNAQDKWPFGYSLLALPFLALEGGSFQGATMLPALAFALVPALLVWAGREIDRDGRGTVAGLLAGALWLTGPLPRALATVAMRETCGAALALAALAAYLRARRVATLSAWRLTGAVLLLLFLTKYNYFVLAGSALALHGVLEMPPERRREQAARWRTAALRSGWRAPGRWMAAVLAVSAVLLLAGENPGNLLYGVLVVATVVGLVSRRRSLANAGELVARLPPALRGLIQTLVAPLWIWLLSPYPSHLRDFFAFLRNRPGQLPVTSAGALVYYPQALVDDYLPSGWLGWLLAGVAVSAALVFAARRGDPARAAALGVLIGILALELHSLKESRFLATVMPLLLLVATVTLSRTGSRLLPANAAARAGIVVGLLSVSLFGSFRLASGHGALSRLEADHRQMTGDPAYLAPLNAVVSRVVHSEGRAGLLGGFNELSESLVRWEAWRSSGREARLVRPLRGVDGAPTAEVVRSKLARWLDRERPRTLVVVRPLAGSRRLEELDYRLYNRWQLEALAALEESREWIPGDARVFPELSLEVRSWTLHQH